MSRATQVLALTGAVTLQQATASFPKKVAGEIAAGLVEGFIGADDVKACVQDTIQDVRELETAIADFKKKTASDVIHGLKELSLAFKGLPAALKACKAVEHDIAEIVKALKDISSPVSFAFHAGKNLVVNSEDIFHEIYTAVQDFEKSDWLDLGVQVGTALHKLIIGVTQKFSEFEQHYGKTYSPEEREKRMATFTENCHQMHQYRRVEEGSAHFSHLSPFADIPRAEFAKRNGFKPSLMDAHSALELAAPLNTTDLPDDFDWVAKGAVNTIKNQGQCGSCWAFATVANIEGAGFVENNKLVSLSEQELVDCDKKTGDQGCQGGLPSNAYKDMIQNKIGLELESAYPYTAANGQCKAKSADEKVFITGSKAISQDEDQIAAALMKYGPLAIGINAGPMQFYMGGIANPWSILCNPKALDHGVAIVGFGTENGKKYWKIRNSWGQGWGEKGYYRIVRGTGKCGLNTMVTTATGVSINSAEDNTVVV